MARVTIGGKRWLLEYRRLNRTTHGYCEPPTTRGKRIVIRRDLRRFPRTLLETLLHEALHAAAWHYDEEAVEQIAEDLARLLWGQGYRLDPAAMPPIPPARPKGA